MSANPTSANTKPKRTKSYVVVTESNLQQIICYSDKSQVCLLIVLPLETRKFSNDSGPVNETDTKHVLTILKWLSISILKYNTQIFLNFTDPAKNKKDVLWQMLKSNKLTVVGCVGSTNLNTRYCIVVT